MTQKTRTNGAVTMPAVSAAIAIIAPMTDLSKIVANLPIGGIRHEYKNIFIELFQEKFSDI